MAVYKRSYRAWSGRLTPEWSRFLIPARYAWRYLFRSRFMTGFFILCFIPALVMGLGLYLNHNESLLKLLRIPSNRVFITNIPNYFRLFLSIQSGFVLLVTAFAAPTMISPDLSNNALPLYFCRPFSRAEYILGKFCVVAALVSWLTWVPGLLLFGIEAGLSGGSWAWDNLWLASAIFVSGLVEVVLLSLIGLALSAWVKWKPIAGALVLGVFFLGAGFGAAINAVVHTTKGYYLDIGHMLNTIWSSLFRVADADAGMSLGGALVQFAVVSALCMLLLSRKIRAFEVIR